MYLCQRIQLVYVYAYVCMYFHVCAGESSKNKRKLRATKAK